MNVLLNFIFCIPVHKDHYENIYCVISGYKDFILIPPSDAPWVPYRLYPVGSYTLGPSTIPPKEGEEVEVSDSLDELTLRNKKDEENSTDSPIGQNSETNEQTKSLRNSNRKNSENVSRKNSPAYRIVPEDPPTTVPWISVDPVNPDLSLYPHYANARPVRVRVHAGDALYLPSLWFHHVRQSHACIAVNYWHDMDYGIKYNYYQRINELTWRNDISWQQLFLVSLMQ